jgi:lysyl-tRNA synthetase class 2
MVFRNEGLDRQHNPEFMMIETMEAYIDYKDNMKLVEEMIEFAVRAAIGKAEVVYQGKKINFKTPWKRMTMTEAVKKATGVDFTKIESLAEGLKVAKKLGLELEKHQKSAIGLILAVAFEQKVEPTLIQPTIIYNFPVETSPLAKKCADDPRFVERWEHFVAGMESSNNYSELNDPQELAERFRVERRKEKMGDIEAHQTDEDFIEAMEYGMPPTSGIGPGIERLIMVLTDSSSIREVILFPIMRPARVQKTVKDEGIRGDKETRVNK